MKIAIATDAWEPYVCGVVTTLNKMISGLKSRGHEILVLHPGLFKNFPCPTYPDIPLSILPGRTIARTLDAFAPDSIMIPTEGPIGLATRNLCVRRGLPFTTAFMTRFPEYVKMRSGLPTAVVYRLMRWFHGQAARTLVATPSLKRELEGRNFGHLHFWGRGVDTELFRPRDKAALILPRPICMYMGRVAMEKNIGEFLNLSTPGTKVVIGDGPALDKLRQKYPEAVFLGRKTGLDLAVHLEAADVFVFPSLTDTFGVVLIEAMACGLPVAAHPVTGPLDVVIQDKTGWLDNDLGLAVKRALQLNPQDCRTHALHFTWERSLDQFEQNMVPIGRPFQKDTK